ncbi:hypothetical protein MIND_01334100 [Mycena indigotica]|uniref:Uncharacterized protein n=1 Tax=Mycena indigotica TaxID=2126181 RepID=A0A8H6VSB4_9AGAR|nr:uncharacterized protein MIND_01334100 [Mycena indigotica]KAF7290206.1 hypothetical protein MIND_01334100 [Mycena indigotica]
MLKLRLAVTHTMTLDGPMGYLSCNDVAPLLSSPLMSTAAIFHVSTIPTLLLVAHRAYTWLVPILYRQMNLQYDRQLQGFLGVAQTCPALLQHVREIVLPTGYPPETTAKVFDGLRSCHKLGGLAMLHSHLIHEVVANGLALPPRLSTHLEGLFQQDTAEHGAPPQIQVGTHHLETLLAFRFVTHLDWFDDLTAYKSDDDEEHARQFIIQLPALTHLAVVPFSAENYVDNLAARLPRLRVLVIVWSLSGYLRRRSDDPVLRIAFRDSRVVCSVYDEWYEGMTSGYRSTFWDLAEELVRGKANSTVPENEFWARPPERHSR